MPRIDSAKSGFWDVGSTWVGGVVPASGDGPRIKATHLVIIRTAVTVHYPEPNEAPFIIENGAEVLVRKGGSLTVTDETRIKIDGDIIVEGWVRWQEPQYYDDCAGRIRLVGTQARVYHHLEGYRYRSAR